MAASRPHIAGFGLAGGIDAVGQLLEEVGHQLIGGLEDCRAQQHFEIQFLNGQLGRVGRQKTGHQLLDLLVLGEEDPGRLVWLDRGLFFFTPMAN